MHLVLLNWKSLPFFKLFRHYENYFISPIIKSYFTLLTDDVCRVLNVMIVLVQ